MKNILTITVSLFLFLSVAYSTEKVPDKAEIAELYIATFNRAPDSDGLDYWTGSNLSLSHIAASFFEQPETQLLYPDGTSTREFIHSVYENLFNRDPDDAGSAYWEENLDEGTIAKNLFILAVINGAQGNDAVILKNKTEVGLYFADKGMNDPLKAQIVMEGINGDYSTVTFIESNMDSSSIEPGIWEKYITLYRRDDGAIKLNIILSGSIQNPVFGPNGMEIIYTLFHEGYNCGPAGIYRSGAFGDNSIKLIDEDGYDSVNLPGASWNYISNIITFASDRKGPDEIWTMSIDGSDLKQITRHNEPGYYIEPSFSPDGQWIVFEADTTEPDESQQGSIYKIRIDGTELTKLTDGPAAGTDDRQPNWSSTGDMILFQRRIPGSNNWDIYIIHPDGSNIRKITISDSSDTDASFSPDGKWIVYSSDYGSLEMPNIFVISTSGGTPIRITNSVTNEDGAPSWSPNGKWIAFESHQGSDEEKPATLWRILVPILH